MKSFLKFLCVAMLMAIGFSSCGEKTPSVWNKTEITEIARTEASNLYFDLINPTYSSVDEVVIDQDAYVDSKNIDSVFYSMPVSTLKRVADVCINKSGQTDKKQIVREYLKNKSVYSNMSVPDPAIATTEKPATDSGGSDVTKKDGVFETSYSYYTDTIDGVPVKVRVKTEKSYEK